jgi:hypothetical protein
VPPSPVIVEQVQLLALRGLRLASRPIAAVRPYVRPRRVHAFGVGAPKSGTHSLAGMFRRYRAAHEPENDLLIPAILRSDPAGPVPDADVLVRARDRRLWLELESSHLLLHLLESLVSVWPDARFILTIRDPYTWMGSALNGQQRKPAPPRWGRLGYYRFREFLPARLPAARELPIADHTLVDRLLLYWQLHNQMVLDLVPPERLLVVRTHELSTSADALAAFLGIPASSVDVSNAHLYKTPKKLDVLSGRRAEIEAAVQKYCAPLMRTYFPDIRSVDDAPTGGVAS